MKQFFFFFFMIAMVLSGFAQPDAIRNEIANMGTDSTTIMITKGRALLLTKLLLNDKSKAMEIGNYLHKNLDNDAYIALFPEELWLLHYWSNNYDNLITSITQNDSTNNFIASKLQPNPDDLLKVLREKSLLTKDAIVASIKKSSLSDQDKDFLILHFHSCFSFVDNAVISQDSLNTLSDSFIKKYHENQSTDYIRKHIRYKPTPSNWSFGGEYNIGYGNFTGQLNNYYSNFITMGFNLEVFYKRFGLFVKGNWGSCTINQDINSKGIRWERHSGVDIYSPEMSLGYTVKETKHFKVTPIAGYLLTDIRPSSYYSVNDQDISVYELKFTTTLSIGLNVDFKFNLPGFEDQTDEYEDNYFIRLHYAYNFPDFSSKYSGFNGNMQYFTIGFGGFERKRKFN